ncbi:acyl-CoA reductase [Noviherbaspirillum sedimenti]|uniref:Long-chain-fatty-acyl-CoA reductase n=1 Tax=Noviherbaspirillum sedimenti TaxID=2320865 RepID=A0A3A3G752_9BURK|nr:acyl-CoA reductase [Noviherbaspirillum sedimenti]RJG03475.1 long-chain-fatty-acyl-CoA reductase [Noviherbaspirillum sedimenti]
MNSVTTPGLASTPLSVGNIIKGRYIEGGAEVYGPPHAQFATSELVLNDLVWKRSEPGPAFETPLAEIMDVLAETGKWLAKDPDGLVAESLEKAARTSPLPYAVLKRSFALLPAQFDRAQLEYQVEREFGGADILDGWRQMPTPPSGRNHRVRAYPPRIVHIIAGNAPLAAALTIVWAALTKGVHLLKLPSNDLFTATMLIRAIASVAPGHPLAQSFSTAYWRGGDTKVESALFRPQYFDKIAAWGGDTTLRNAKNYIGPGFELVAFDPKTSISMIGREAFESDAVLTKVADLAATDATLIEQQACASSRYQFVEGSTEEVDRYCAKLIEKMGVERPFCTPEGRPLPTDMREEVEGLRGMDDFYRVWGDYNGSGVVIRSEDPVGFHPDGRVVNVVAVPNLADALQYVTLATQTVGVYPPARKAELRNALACAGVQRVVDIGNAGGVERGLPHDGFYPLQRFVRWVNDEGGEVS